MIDKELRERQERAELDSHVSQCDSCSHYRANPYSANPGRCTHGLIVLADLPTYYGQPYRPDCPDWKS